jgi:hypothetical protein
MMMHIRTINLLGPDVVSQFKALLFLNQGNVPYSMFASHLSSSLLGLVRMYPL